MTIDAPLSSRVLVVLGAGSFTSSSSCALGRWLFVGIVGAGAASFLVPLGLLPIRARLLLRFLTGFPWKLVTIT